MLITPTFICPCVINAVLNNGPLKAEQGLTNHTSMQLEKIRKVELVVLGREIR